MFNKMNTTQQGIVLWIIKQFWKPHRKRGYFEYDEVEDEQVSIIDFRKYSEIGEVTFWIHTIAIQQKCDEAKIGIN